MGLNTCSLSDPWVKGVRGSGIIKGTTGRAAGGRAGQRRWEQESRESTIRDTGRIRRETVGRGSGGKAGARSYPDGAHRTSPHTLTLVRSWAFGTSRVSSAPPGSYASSLDPGAFAVMRSRTISTFSRPGFAPRSKFETGGPSHRPAGQVRPCRGQRPAVEMHEQLPPAPRGGEHGGLGRGHPGVCAELEEGKNEDFWSNRTAVVEDKIAKRRKLEALG